MLDKLISSHILFMILSGISNILIADRYHKRFLAHHLVRVWKNPFFAGKFLFFISVSMFHLLHWKHWRKLKTNFKVECLIGIYDWYCSINYATAVRLLCYWNFFIHIYYIDYTMEQKESLLFMCNNWGFLNQISYVPSKIKKITVKFHNLCFLQLGC